MCSSAKISTVFPATLSLAMFVAACTASPPSGGIGGGDGGITNYTEYPNVATCTPQGACPGAACSSSAIGPPDGIGVSLPECRVLDLVFTGGNIAAVVGQPDAKVYLLGLPQGTVRVEASTDGVDYVVTGFLGPVPDDNASSCATSAPIEAGSNGTIATLNFDQCNSIANVAFLRFNADVSSMAAAGIDAVEAVSVVVP